MEKGFEINQAPAERAYDREAVENESMKKAKFLVESNIDSNLQGIERFNAMKKFMESLAPQNENRHVVEAIAQMLTIERADHESHVVRERYPKAAATLRS